MLQKVLGHSSLQMTQNYINLLVSDMKNNEQMKTQKEYGITELDNIHREFIEMACRREWRYNAPITENGGVFCRERS